MSLLSVLPKKIFGLFMTLVALFKRVICRIQRGRKNSGTLLPMHNSYSTPQSVDVQHAVPDNESTLEPWDSWGQDELGTSHNGAAVLGDSPEVEGEDIDFFQDMTPSFKKPAKILIRKKENLNSMAPSGGGISSRLTMMAEIPAHGADLETWEDGDGGQGWEDSATDDTAWEADAAIREKRKLERERKLQEHQRKKVERDQQRLSKKDSSLTAVKLS